MLIVRILVQKLLLTATLIVIILHETLARPLRFEDEEEDRGHKMKKRRRRPCYGRDAAGGDDGSAKTFFDWHLYYSDVNYNFNHNYNVNCGANNVNNDQPSLGGNHQSSHPVISQLAGQLGSGVSGIIPPGGIGSFASIFNNGGGGVGAAAGSGSSGGGLLGGLGNGVGFGSILGSPAEGSAGGPGLGFFGQNGLFDFTGSWLSQRPPVVASNPIAPISSGVVQQSEDVVQDVPNDPILDDRPVHKRPLNGAAGGQFWRPGQYVGIYNPALGGYYQNLNAAQPDRVIRKINRQINKIAKPFYDLFFKR